MLFQYVFSLFAASETWSILNSIINVGNNRDHAGSCLVDEHKT